MTTKITPETVSALMSAWGRKGGKVKSERKAAAAAANLAGKRTGRKRLPDDQVSPAALVQRARREALKATEAKGE